MGTLHAIDDTGDTRTIWDPHRPTEVEAARKQFDQLKKRGYLAYRVSEGGEAAEVMREFDPEAGKVIMRPQLPGG